MQLLNFFDHVRKFERKFCTLFYSSAYCLAKTDCYDIRPLFHSSLSLFFAYFMAATTGFIACDAIRYTLDALYWLYATAFAVYVVLDNVAMIRASVKNCKSGRKFYRL